MKKEKNGSRTMRLILRFAKGNGALFLCGVLFAILNTLFNILNPQIVKITVDCVLGELPLGFSGQLGKAFAALKAQDPIFLLLIAAGVILLVALGAAASNFVSRVTLAKGSENLVKALRDTLFSHIQKLPFSWHVANQTGEIIQRCTSDVDVVRNFISTQLLEVFHTGFLIVLSLWIMFSMNVKLSLIALCFIPIVIAYTAIFYSQIARRFREADVAEGALSSVVQENLTGVRVVRAFGRERFEIERFDEKNSDFANFWIKLGMVQSYYWGIGDLFSNLQILVIAAVGVVEAVNGNLSLGEFLAFISYNTMLLWPVRSMGRILSEMSKAGVSADRLAYILDSQPEADSPEAVEAPLDGDIEFHDVSFHYEGFYPVFSHLSFKIPAGTTFAILGGTGSGKSTLMHLLNRLYDLPEGCGKITVGGIDIADMPRGWLRSHVGMVLQEPFLFSRTIRENISAFHPEAPMREIRKAAQIACVDEAITDFSEGYDTVVGERGVTLSGGQKQRVAIARMLMQEAPIMVFDDSLSAVDSETDSKIRKALHQSLGSSTVILISHRITTLMQAAQILVLENGSIEELGTHAQLLSKNGIYKSIYDIQMNADDRRLLEQEEKDAGI